MTRYSEMVDRIEPLRELLGQLQEAINEDIEIQNILANLPDGFDIFGQDEPNYALMRHLPEGAFVDAATYRWLDTQMCYAKQVVDKIFNLGKPMGAVQMLIINSKYTNPH